MKCAVSLNSSLSFFSTQVPMTKAHFTLRPVQLLPKTRLLARIDYCWPEPTIVAPNPLLLTQTQLTGSEDNDHMNSKYRWDSIDMMHLSCLDLHYQFEVQKKLDPVSFERPKVLSHVNYYYRMSINLGYVLV